MKSNLLAVCLYTGEEQVQILYVKKMLLLLYWYYCTKRVVMLH